MKGLEVMIKAYHRPNTLEDALRLQARSGIKTALLPGYDALIDDTIDEVVDLQALPLRGIHSSEDTLTLESLVTLQQIAEHAEVPDWLRQLTREEEPSTLRNMRTVASVVLGPNAESLLLAALLAADTQLQIQTLTGSHDVPLSSWLAAPADGFPVRVTLAVDTQVAVAKVARTPADKPIVAAAARRGPDGYIRLALSGVAPTPILVHQSEMDALVPVSDFRGSAQYRKEMAAVLSQRVLAQV